MQKLISFLGIVKKAGMLSVGSDPVLQALKSNSSKLILFSADASQNTVSKIKKKSQLYGVKALFLKIKKDELYQILKKSCAVLSVNDINFAIKVQDLISKEEIY